MAKGLDKQKNEKKKGKSLKEKRAEKKVFINLIIGLHSLG